MSDSSSLIVPRKVTGGGEGLVTHGGLAWLGAVADRTGLTSGLREATAGLEWRKHQPGHTLLVHAVGEGGVALEQGAHGVGIALFDGVDDLLPVCGHGPLPCLLYLDRG